MTKNVAAKALRMGIFQPKVIPNKKKEESKKSCRKK